MLQVHNIVRLFLAIQGDSRVSPLLKLQAWCGLVYIFSPLDIMPEMFTGIGLLDDIIVSLIIMQALLELAPRQVVEEHCTRLGIRTEQIFISVPQTVREARSLYAFLREIGVGIRGIERGAQPMAQEEEAGANSGGEAEPQASTTTTTRRSRYSVNRNPEQGD